MGNRAPAPHDAVSGLHPGTQERDVVILSDRADHALGPESRIGARLVRYRHPERDIRDLQSTTIIDLVPVITRTGEEAAD